MTRSGRSPRALVALFGTDPYGAVVRVLQEADAALTAAEIKQALRTAGVPEVDARAWDPLQRKLRADEHIVVEPSYRYRWVADPGVPSAAEAFERIVLADGGRVPAAHVDVVRQALATAADDLEDAARHRQTVLDGLRALAELASEVEELTVNEASARAMVHRVRSRVKLAGLEPVERAGDTVAFDRKRHELIGPPVRDGAPVVVVRPGYAWRTAHEEVLVARAVVQE